MVEPWWPGQSRLGMTELGRDTNQCQTQGDIIVANLSNDAQSNVEAQSHNRNIHKRENDGVGNQGSRDALSVVRGAVEGDGLVHGHGDGPLRT
jgi:hypothetical protein